jgi:hypothetical protein
VGVLKPNVIMFGESIPTLIKTAAEAAIDSASRILVVGSSLATYSAWRLVKRAHERGMGIGILNMGGVRKEEAFFGEYHPRPNDQGGGAEAEAEAEAEADDHKGLSAMRRAVVRASLPAEEILPAVVERIRQEERNKVQR